MTFDLSIVVNSCDKYNFLWTPFSELFNQYWDKEIDVPKYILGETQSAKIDGFDFILPGKNSWTHNVKFALDSIKTKYVLWINDDYFFVRTLFKDNFECFFYLIDHYNCDKFIIHYPHAELKLNNLLDEYQIYSMSQDSPYTTTLQSSIWNVELFKWCLKENETPWQFELNGTERLNKKGHTILLKLIQERWYWEAMTKGKFNPEYYHILNSHNKSHLIHTL